MEYRLKRLPAVFTLTGEDGRTSHTIQRIGAGRYCTAFRDMGDPAVVYLRVKDSDVSKAVLSDCDGPHVPELERIGMMGDDYLWKTRYYQRLTAKSKLAWSQYRTLAKCMDEARLARRWTDKGYGRNEWGLDDMRDCIDRAVAAGLPEALTQALEQIADSSSNYGRSFTFEFAPRNLAVDCAGNLILLDPIFDMAEIEAAMMAARKRADNRRGRGFYGV